MRQQNISRKRTIVVWLPYQNHAEGDDLKLSATTFAAYWNRSVVPAAMLVSSTAEFEPSIEVLTRDPCDVLLEILRKRGIVRSFMIEVRKSVVEQGQKWEAHLLVAAYVHRSSEC